MIPFALELLILTDTLLDDAMDREELDGGTDRCLAFVLGVASSWRDPAFPLRADAPPVEGVRFFATPFVGLPGVIGELPSGSTRPAAATFEKEDGGAEIRRGFGVRAGMEVESFGFGFDGTGVASGSRDRCLSVNGDWDLPAVDEDVRRAWDIDGCPGSEERRENAVTLVASEMEGRHVSMSCNEVLIRA